MYDKVMFLLNLIFDAIDQLGGAYDQPAFTLDYEDL